MSLDGDSMFKFHDTTPIDPSKLVIQKGDTVLYENQEYIVKEAGMRWLRLRKKDGTPGEYSMRKTDVVKIHPEAQKDATG